MPKRRNSRPIITKSLLNNVFVYCGEKSLITKNDLRKFVAQTLFEGIAPLQLVLPVNREKDALSLARKFLRNRISNHLASLIINDNICLGFEVISCTKLKMRRLYSITFVASIHEPRMQE